MDHEKTDDAMFQFSVHIMIAFNSQAMNLFFLRKVRTVVHVEQMKHKEE